MKMMRMVIMAVLVSILASNAMAEPVAIKDIKLQGQDARTVTVALKQYLMERGIVRFTSNGCVLAGELTRHDVVVYEMEVTNYDLDLEGVTVSGKVIEIHLEHMVLSNLLEYTAAAIARQSR